MAAYRRNRKVVTNPRLPRGLIGFLALLATLAMIGACTPQEPGATPDPLRLHANLVSNGFNLDWQATALGAAAGYQLQVMELEKSNGAWTDIDAAAEVNGSFPAEATFTAVTEGNRYRFRVREATDSAAAWSTTGDEWFITPTLPIVRIDTESRTPILNKVDKIPMRFQIDPNGSDFDALDVSGEIRGRGNTTWFAPKKPYWIKFGSKADVMDMGKSKKWVLLANYYDRSQVRTYAGAQISHATDLIWTPGYRWVEVILNGKYQGMYQLADKVESGSDKADLGNELTTDDNNGDAVTGPYLLEMDGRIEQSDDPGWTTPQGQGIAVSEPDPPTPQQLNYIKAHVNAFEKALFSSNFTDPENGYAKYLDRGSFVDFWIVQETVRNFDSFQNSNYFYKYRNDLKLHFGPMWDFDNSMGNSISAWELAPEGWTSQINRKWPRQLFKDPAVVQAVKQRWVELLPQMSQIPDRIRAESSDPAFVSARANDRLRWADEYGNTKPDDDPEYVATWLADRLTWMTTAIAQMNG